MSADPFVQTGQVIEQGQDPNSTVTQSTETVVTQAQDNTVSPTTTTENNLPSNPPNEIDQMFGLPTRTQKPAAETTPASVVDEPAPTQNTQTEQLSEREIALTERIRQLEVANAAVQMFEQNPIEFISKHFPGIVIEQFDPVEYVAKKINEKYGMKNDDGTITPFVPDPAKVFIPGTPDYNYARDLEKFNQEAGQAVTGAQQAQEEAKQQGIQRFNASKETVKTKYGMTEDVFNQKVWKILENVDNGKALELMADGIVLKEKYETLLNNLKKGVTRTDILPGVTEAGTTQAPGTISKGQQEVASVLGEKMAAQMYQN